MRSYSKNIPESATVLSEKDGQTVIAENFTGSNGNTYCYIKVLGPRGGTRQFEIQPGKFEESIYYENQQ